jgi:hypothetical protein
LPTGRHRIDAAIASLGNSIQSALALNATGA